jgi:hypothetical protein
MKPQSPPSLLLGLEPVQFFLRVARVVREQKLPRSVEQQIVINFLVGENGPPPEIHHRLQQQYGEECLSQTHVFEWCKCFREGREAVCGQRRRHTDCSGVDTPPTTSLF